MIVNGFLVKLMWYSGNKKKGNPYIAIKNLSIKMKDIDKEKLALQ